MSSEQWIQIILASTVLSAILTGCFTTIIQSKKNVLDNITNERKVWRETLREISCEIYAADEIEALHISSVKLQTRLNTFGILNSNNYLIDGHIWKLLKKFDEADCYNENIDKEKQRLIKLISALLKYDWERAKSEITGNTTKKFGFIFVVAQIIAIVLFNDSQNIKGIILYLISNLIIYLLTFVSETVRKMNNIYDNKNIQYIMHIHRKTLILLYIVLFLAIISFSLIVDYRYFILTGCSLLFSLVGDIRELHIEECYIKTIYAIVDDI